MKKTISLFMPLFFTALISEVLYQFLSGISEAKKVKGKRSNFNKLPIGQYKIRDNLSNTDVGELSNADLDFLRMRYLEQGMDDNNLYFAVNLLPLFLREAKPNQGLTDFLNKAMKNKNEIELHWEPI